MVAMVDVDVPISSYLKEELAWAVGKWLRLISTIMLFKKQQFQKSMSRIIIS